MEKHDLSLAASPGWNGLDSEIANHVRIEAENTLAAYRVQPNFVAEHVAIEQSILTGGYGHRQIYELVQNAADAILSGGTRGRVHVLLAESALYCANEGEPIDRDGVTAILTSHVSRKMGSQIGNFGIGFKSVLAITRKPQFFSRSGSFGFDADAAADRIHQCVPNGESTPILRIGEPLDPAEAAASDPNLSELMSWATTIVRLPRGELRSNWLSEDLKSFPASFLLFSPHVKLLILEDRTTGERRAISLSNYAGVTKITEGVNTSHWRVFHGYVAPKDMTLEARQDANPRVIDREELPIIWAVPLDTKRSRGRFWAFFPTQEEMTLTGILNAPWKTNSDRQNLLEGAFNNYLLDNTVLLVTRSLPALLDSADPGGILDLLPARDTVGWADNHLEEGIYKELSKRPSVPDTTSSLARACELLRRPEYVLKDKIQKLLQAGNGDGISAHNWCHSTVEQRERRARVKKLGGEAEAGLADWVSAVASARTLNASSKAITLVGALWDELHLYEQSLLRRTAFILTTDGELACPDQNDLFLPADIGYDRDDVCFVHPELAENDETRSVLTKIGIMTISPSAEFKAWARKVSSWASVDWQEFWGMARRVSVEEAMNILAAANVIRWVRVRTLAGEFQTISRTLKPGSIVPNTGERDKLVALDTQFHQQDLVLLDRLGLVESPVPRQVQVEDNWFNQYRKEAKQKLCDALQPNSSQPQWDYLKFTSTLTCGPLDPLQFLSIEGNACFVKALLPYATVESPWIMKHKSRSDYYPSVEMEPPCLWVIRKFGRLHTSLGILRVSEAVAPNLEEWRILLPVAQCTAEQARFIGLPESFEDLTEFLWQSTFRRVELALDDSLAGRFYANVAKIKPPPEKIRCSLGVAKDLRNPKEVVATCSETEILLLRVAGTPFVVVPDRESAATLCKYWGLQAAELIRIDFVGSGDEIDLIDRFPGLKTFLGDDRGDIRLQPCLEVWVEVRSPSGGVSRQSLVVAKSDHLLCFVDSLTTDELLDRIIEELDLHLQDFELWGVKSYLEREERQRHVAQIRGCQAPQEKLLVAIGPEAIHRLLPEGLIAELVRKNGELAPEDAAAAAMAVHGVEVLNKCAADLEDVGLDPPRQWYGSPRAVDFVQELGFPAAFAGFETTRRSPIEEVDGPIKLKPLHDFQEEIATRIEGFMAKGLPSRGLVSLPTGAGKTRVVVEALVRCACAGSLDGCFMWIAQSDELCEQAVQTWMDVWRSVGPRRKLRISRLWGATNNRVVSVEGLMHLVVATFQTLVRRVEAIGYEWLKDVSCVVVDEAHGSTTPSYTQILTSLGLTHRETARPLIGLTATPFRGGADEEETRRLVGRYGGYRFDHGVLDGDDPYPVLQRMGILASVDHQLLPGGWLDLNYEELEHLKQYQVLPPSAELRLGQDSNRNTSLLKSIQQLPSDWPVLAFTTSVEHAGLLAALLSLEGISAKAISAETDMRARRYYIEEFKAGRIRVLTNYNVLTTGFDAPAVRALYIARPVYSRGLYQQMIGRGLRGPMNGGKERCLIVNVEDNISQYGEQLAFRHFEFLWDVPRP
ncbi:MAG: DEAD/DEAH box helicase family protein [Syntrophobacteraceae bacterium]